MTQLRTNEQTEELLNEIVKIWENEGNIQIAKISLVNCALRQYRDHLKTIYSK